MKMMNKVEKAKIRKGRKMKVYS